MTVKDDFIKKILICMFVFLTIFTIGMIIIFLQTGSTPDTLIVAVLLEVWLTVIQSAFVDMGFIVMATIVVMLCVYFKNKPTNWWVKVSDDLSLIIYLVHPLFITIVGLVLSSMSNWITPIIVGVLSVLFSYLCTIIKHHK